MNEPSADTDHPDARALRGLAHPLRLRILGLLRSDGPSTASRLGRALGESSGATSYHLRQLAIHGFVVSDDGAAPPGHSRRERWWRAAHRFTDLPRAPAREGDPAAEGFLRALAEDFHRETLAFVDEVHALPAGWEVGWTLTDRLLRLTPTEAERLRAELAEVVVRYRSEAPGDAQSTAPDGAERVLVQVQILPRPQPPPRPR